jgi:hypothetical protein
LKRRLHLFIIIVCLCLGQLQKADAQYVTVAGTVYDLTARNPLEAVAVRSTSGRGGVTDSAGRYIVTVLKTDSIWFSMIGKNTMKYSVDTISNLDNFNIMIHVKAADLPEVKVRNNYYRYDSIQNRLDNAKGFNFKKPGLSLSSNPNYNPGGLTVGFDLEAIINMFRFKRNQNMEFLQKRLIDQEQEKYVNFRFSKAFVRKITLLNSPELDSFMVRYRPPYELVKQLNDLEFGYYIEKQLELYRKTKNMYRGSLRKRDD